ncbi:MAG: MvdD family ATP-grasp ribosomal peptide maturase [Bacteroidetes bacterium]|nr:MAG: MvdD family ATP-grasp ribosomal peptide maturase [Bacteroidota bacterium]
MKKVLIVTFSEDNECIDMVSDAIKSKGGEVIRFDTDLYPSEYSLSLQYINGKWSNILNTKDSSYGLDDLEAVWYRRLRIGDSMKGQMEKKYLGPSLEESKRTFLGMLNSLDVFHFDSYLKIRHAEIKQLQLKVAENLGLKIPKTLITNNAGDVREFNKQCVDGLITKMQSSFAIYEGEDEHVVFTNVLSDEDLKNLDDIQSCPMQFQEKIEKKLELRVTVIGDKIFSAAIDSQKSELSKDDWRKQGLELINDWEEYALPDDIQEKLLKFMDYFKVNYGAADFILTPDDELYFLESNPAGEFFWLERTNPHFPLSDAIANVLLGKAKRRF